MNIRVNLLKPSEARRQSVVSVKFMVQISMGTAIVILLMVGRLMFTQYRIVQRDLEAARKIWEIRKPMYDQVVKMKENVATERKFQQELQGWQTSRMDWDPLLIELRKNCPPIVQLKRLGIRGELFIKQKPPPPAEDSGGQTSSSPATPSPGSAMRWYTITIDGKASGDMAEDVVIQFVRTLGNNELFKPIFESPPRLNSMRRDTSQGDEKPIRIFTIEGSTLKREIK